MMVVPQRLSLDVTQNEVVRLRSGGRCEVLTLILEQSGDFVDRERCYHPATEIHHLIGGWKRRGRGSSALAEHKQHVCRSCHRAITGMVGGRKLVLLRRGALPRFDDVYELRGGPDR